MLEVVFRPLTAEFHLASAWRQSYIDDKISLNQIIVFRVASVKTPVVADDVRPGEGYWSAIRPIK